jgi:prepilin-type N-terminal cleavage/methylation domain-containing protein
MKHLTKWFKCEAGFTIVELLIATLLLGIVSAMVVSRFGSLTDEFRIRADVFSAQSYARDVELKIITGVINGPSTGELVISANDLGVTSLDAQFNDYDFYITVEGSNVSSYDWIIKIVYTDGTSFVHLSTDGEDDIEGYEKYVTMIE